LDVQLGQVCAAADERARDGRVRIKRVGVADVAREVHRHRAHASGKRGPCADRVGKSCEPRASCAADDGNAFEMVKYGLAGFVPEVGDAGGAGEGGLVERGEDLGEDLGDEERCWGGSGRVGRGHEGGEPREHAGVSLLHSKRKRGGRS